MVMMLDDVGLEVVLVRFVQSASSTQSVGPGSCRVQHGHVTTCTLTSLARVHPTR
jgi:hypothetical protein